MLLSHRPWSDSGAQMRKTQRARFITCPAPFSIAETADAMNYAAAASPPLLARHHSRPPPASLYMALRLSFWASKPTRKIHITATARRVIANFHWRSYMSASRKAGHARYSVAHLRLHIHGDIDAFHADIISFFEFKLCHSLAERTYGHFPPHAKRHAYIYETYSAACDTI